jgi:hypothetical protein
MSMNIPPKNKEAYYTYLLRVWERSYAYHKGVRLLIHLRSKGEN